VSTPGWQDSDWYAEAINREKPKVNPIVSFDTSAFNRLAKSQDFDTLRLRINQRYHLRMTETAIVELLATEDRDLRARLFGIERTLRNPGDVTFPHHVLLATAVDYFEAHRSKFDWRKMSIRSSKLEAELAKAPWLNDELSEQQRKQFIDAEIRWVQTFQRLSERFDANLKDDQRPKTLGDLVSWFEEQNSPLRESWGRMLYKRSDGTEGRTEDIQEFHSLFPPFRAMLLAMLVQQWERCFRDSRSGLSYRAGRNDTVMATYLPYCNVFVCDDKRQRNLLTEVVRSAKIAECEIISSSALEDRL
jgi:hypothetical protein